MERVGLSDPLLERFAEPGEGAALLRVGVADADLERRARRDDGADVRCHLRPLVVGVHRLAPPADDGLVDAILHVRRGVRAAPKRRSAVRLVLREQERLASASPSASTYHHRSPRWRCSPCTATVLFVEASRKRRLRRPALPRPRVAVPQVREEVDRRRLRPPIRRDDPAEDVLLVDLRVLDLDVEIAARFERIAERVDQLELRVVPPAPPVLGDEFAVGESDLRVLVEHPHVAVRRRAVEVEVVLLHVLAVVALVAGQPEEALLEDGVALVPEGDAEAHVLEAVTEAAERVLVPAIRAAAGVVVREVFPRLPVRAVVLADGPPGPVADVGSPLLPVGTAGFGGSEAAVLGRIRKRHRSAAKWEEGARHDSI